MTEATTAPAPAAPKVQKTIGVTLSDGAGNQMRILGQRHKDGSFSVYLQRAIKDDKGKLRSAERGASTKFTGADALSQAQAYITKAEGALTKEGWIKRRGGFGGAKPDTFTLANLPKPAKGAPKK